MVGDGCDECNPEKAKELKTMKLSELTLEQKRIAIAEACGWINCEIIQYEGFSMKAIGYRSKSAIGFESLPDYFNDLNAMHEVEKTLDGAIMLSYYFELDELMERPPMVIRLVMATAAQRADAFLLATGRAEL
jgi:hypothetical protein